MMRATRAALLLGVALALAPCARAADAPKVADAPKAADAPKPPAAPKPAAAAAPNAAAPPKCKPGCLECVELQGAELDQWSKTKELRLSMFLSRLGGRKRAHEGQDAAPTKCTKCAENFQLKEGRCMCPAGFGVTFTPKAANATQPRRHPGGALKCARCDAGFASGPDAPRPAKQHTWGGKRDLLAGGSGGGRGGGKGAKGGRFPPVCVKCASGKSNAERTKCA